MLVSLLLGVEDVGADFAFSCSVDRDDIGPVASSEEEEDDFT